MKTNQHPKYLLLDTITGSPLTRLVAVDAAGKSVSEARSKGRSLFLILKKFFGTKAVAQIKGIAVLNGPGEFSTVRQGVVMANSLSWATGLPIAPIQAGDRVNDRSKWSHDFVAAIYSRPPNITR